ncbi:hypothetical protein [Oerskovia jenensis]|uniref:hypothetical protein n=1 Tax=Oerskovia jenensis TaxID=162169 RepID=UPI0036DD8DB3
MAGRRFVAAVVLRRPGTFTATTFLPGDEAPEWAEELVTNEDVFEPEDGTGTAPGEPDPPSMKWTAAQLTDYAEEHGVPLVSGAKKADILAAIAAAAEAAEAAELEAKAAAEAAELEAKAAAEAAEVEAKAAAASGEQDPT